MSDERIVHSLIAVVFWAAYLVLGKPACSAGQKTALLPVALAGAWLPDLDLLIGVGFHRSPLTHSFLPVFLASLGMRHFSRFVIPAGLAIGVSSHLFWDIIFFGNVKWIPGGAWDRLFLLVNSLVLIVWAVQAGRRRGKCT